MRLHVWQWLSQGLTGNTTVTPYTLAVYSEEHGYLTDDGNTIWSFITEGGKEFGVQGQTISLNEETVTETLMEEINHMQRRRRLY